MGNGNVRGKLVERFVISKDGTAGTIYGMPVTTALSKEELLGVIMLLGDEITRREEEHQCFEDEMSNVLRSRR